MIYLPWLILIPYSDARYTVRLKDSLRMRWAVADGYIVFDLPKDILSSLHLKSGGDAARQSDGEGNNEDDKPSTQLGDGIPSGTTSCALCGIKVNNVQDQRRHVKSDFHRYNLKQKLKGFQPVSETEFDTLVVGMLGEVIQNQALY